MITHKSANKAPDTAAIAYQIAQIQFELHSLEYQLSLLPSIPKDSSDRERQTLAAEIYTKNNDLTVLQNKLNSIFIESYQAFTSNAHEIERVVANARDKANLAMRLSDKARIMSEDALKTATEASKISKGFPLIEHFKARDQQLNVPLGIGMLLTTVLFLLTLLFVVFAKDILGSPNTASEPLVVLFMFSNVMTISLFMVAIVWCARLFKETYDRKNFYRHKMALINTWVSFVHSSISPEKKDVLINDSFKHIFSDPLPSTKTRG